MTVRTDDLYLVDMIEAADAIGRILRQQDFATFARDEVRRSAVLWKLYVFAEAALKLSHARRNRFLDFPWPQVRGLRNRMAHGYFTLKWDQVWTIASQDVRAARAQAETILARDFPDTYRRLQERRNSGDDAGNA